MYVKVLGNGCRHNHLTQLQVNLEVLAKKNANKQPHPKQASLPALKTCCCFDTTYFQPSQLSRSYHRESRMWRKMNLRENRNHVKIAVHGRLLLTASYNWGNIKWLRLLPIFMQLKLMLSFPSPIVISVPILCGLFDFDLQRQQRKTSQTAIRPTEIMWSG